MSGLTMNQIIGKILYDDIKTKAAPEMLQSAWYFVFIATINAELDVVVKKTMISNPALKRQEDCILGGGKDKMLKNMPESFKRQMYKGIMAAGSEDITSDLDSVLLYTEIEESGTMSVHKVQIINTLGKHEFINIDLNL